MPDRVDAAVEAMQPPASNTSWGRTLAYAECFELRQRNDPVLSLGDFR
jgi:hypothetical protein